MDENLEQKRKECAEKLSKSYEKSKVALKVEATGNAATILTFVAEGMNQETADMFCSVSTNKELFSNLRFNEVVFSDGDKFSYSYIVMDENLELKRKNCAADFTKFYEDKKVALKVETTGNAATILTFVAEGMNQETADMFCSISANKELFSNLRFNEVVFSDGDKFSYSYIVSDHKL